MRATHISLNILQASLFVLFNALATNALADDTTYRSIGHDGSDPVWVCEYLYAPDGDLYMFCNDKVSLLNDDLVDDNEVQPRSAKSFPVWSQPRSEARAIDLAQRVLCDPREMCRVEMASGFGNRQLAGLD